MYIATVALLTFVLPLVSAALDPAPLAAAAGRWFVFWSVGVRLLVAGVRQIAQPRYTARHVLGIDGDAVLPVVRELGFANAALGIAGCVAVLRPWWIAPLALAGGVFYGLAGINHLLQRGRNRLQNVALVSDLFAAAVLLGWCGGKVLR